jgi:hypothetical protein
MKRLVSFILLIATVAASASLTYPQIINMNDGVLDTQQQVLYMGTFDLGNAAPNQELTLIFSRNTGENGALSSASIFWQSAEGNVDYSLSGSAITVTHRIPEISGDYYFNVTLKGSDVGTITPHIITFKVFVKKEIYTYDYTENHTVMAGVAKSFDLLIRSSSAAGETLSFRNSEGIPSSWITAGDSRNSIFIEPYGTRTVAVTLTPNEEGNFDANLFVLRESSNVRDSLPLNVRVKPTVQSKLRAFSEGFSIIPVVMQPFYSLLSMMGLI